MPKAEYVFSKTHRHMREHRVAAIWGYDISVYCAAGFGAITGVLSFIKLFLKD